VGSLRKILLKFHVGEEGNTSNQFFFLTQILIAITLLGTANQDAGERVLSVVFTKQLAYCENN
jgi:hypothetical protein